jgi:hypothetical protein
MLQVPGDMQERFATYLAIRIPMKSFREVKPPWSFPGVKFSKKMLSSILHL